MTTRGWHRMEAVESSIMNKSYHVLYNEVINNVYDDQQVRYGIITNVGILCV